MAVYPECKKCGDTIFAGTVVCNDCLSEAERLKVTLYKLTRYAQADPQQYIAVVVLAQTEYVARAIAVAETEESCWMDAFRTKIEVVDISKKGFVLGDYCVE